VTAAPVSVADKGFDVEFLEPGGVVRRADLSTCWGVRFEDVPPVRSFPSRHHRPGTLTTLDGYLHQRTGGMIGSLSHLIRGAAIEAILDGSESITKRLLDAVELDHAAQHRTPEPRTKRAG
jgi:hypothetical protein